MFERLNVTCNYGELWPRSLLTSSVNLIQRLVVDCQVIKSESSLLSKNSRAVAMTLAATNITWVHKNQILFHVPLFFLQKKVFRLLVGEFYHNPSMQKETCFFFPHFALSSAMDEPFLDDTDHGNCYGALFLCCDLKERTQATAMGSQKPATKKMMFPEFNV